MAQMIRKQIYLQKRQDMLLKKLARLRQVSEAELIREAIDQQIGQATVRPTLPDPEAWEKALKFMLELRKRGPVSNQPRAWTRRDAYQERMSRYDRHSH
jgi:hypothetical protein